MKAFLAEFGKRIREYRKLKGYSKETLAALVGVSTNSVAAWERGETFIRRSVLEKLCQVFNISPSDLFGNPYINHEIEKGSLLEQILNITKKLSISKQKQVLEILKTFNK